MLDIRRIIQLKARGKSNRSIARLLGINRKTVNEYALYLQTRLSRQCHLERGIDIRATGKDIAQDTRWRYHHTGFRPALLQAVQRHGKLRIKAV